MVDRLSLLDVVPVLVAGAMDVLDAPALVFEASGPVIRWLNPFLPECSSPDVNVSTSEDRRVGLAGRRVAVVTGGRVGGLFRLLPGAVRDVVLLLVVAGFAVEVAAVREAVEAVAPGLLGAAEAEPVARLGGTFSDLTFFAVVAGAAALVSLLLGVLVSRSEGNAAGSVDGASTETSSVTADSAGVVSAILASTKQYINQNKAEQIEKQLNCLYHNGNRCANKYKKEARWMRWTACD